MNDSDGMRKLAQMMIDNGATFEEPTPPKKEETEPYTLGEKIFWWTILVCIVVPFIAMFFDTGSGSGSGGTSERAKLRQAEKIMKSQLNYPSSYSLQGWGVNGNRVTLEFKAKNAFGMEKTEIRTIIVD